MKVAINQELDAKTNKKEKIHGKQLERLMVRTVAIVLFILIAVQAALYLPFLRKILTNGNKLEGYVLKDETYLFTPCKMELKLLNLDNCPDLDVLVNGEKQGSFQSNTVMLELKEGDVVELDAGSILVEAIVQVSAVSSNISDFLGKTMTVTDGIIPVALMKPKQ